LIFPVTRLPPPRVLHTERSFITFSSVSGDGAGHPEVVARRRLAHRPVRTAGT